MYSFQYISKTKAESWLYVWEKKLKMSILTKYFKVIEIDQVLSYSVQILLERSWSSTQLSCVRKKKRNGKLYFVVLSLLFFPFPWKTKNQKRGSRNREGVRIKRVECERERRGGRKSIISSNSSFRRKLFSLYSRDS